MLRRSTFSLGFALVGSINYPEDGEVWEWQVRNHALSVTLGCTR
jgi:hypothetical protein